MRTLLLDVPDARCGVCRAAVVGAMQRLDGVLTAEVDLGRSLAAVTFDETRQTAAAIEDALTQAGYPPQRRVPSSTSAGHIEPPEATP